MDGKEYPVRIVRFGIVFFGDKGTATFSGDSIVVTKGGVEVQRLTKSDIKGGAVNDMNGLWTIKLNNGQKLNIVGLGATKADFNATLNAIMEQV